MYPCAGEPDGDHEGAFWSLPPLRTLHTSSFLSECECVVLTSWVWCVFIELDVVLQCDREMELAVAGAEPDVPELIVELQGTR